MGMAEEGEKCGRGNKKKVLNKEDRAEKMKRKLTKISLTKSFNAIT